MNIHAPRKIRRPRIFHPIIIREPRVLSGQRHEIARAFVELVISPTGQRILRQGFTGTGFYVIVDGRCAVPETLRMAVIPSAVVVAAMSIDGLEIWLPWKRIVPRVISKRRLAKL